MKGRLFFVFTLAAGLAVLLTWSAAARDAPLVLPTDRTEFASSRPNMANPGLLSDVPSTTDFIYLPLVVRSYRECTIVPTLISPADTSVLDTLIPTLKWYTGDNPNAIWLHYQLSADADFADNILIGQTSFTTGNGESIRDDNLEPATVYYWRTWLECADGLGPYTKTWSFTTGSDGILLSSPTLLSPADGDSVPSTKVTFQWESLPGAVQYRVWWHDLNEDGYYLMTVNNTQYTPFEHLNPNATYEWGLKARNDYGWGDYSEIWQFTTPASAVTP